MADPSVCLLITNSNVKHKLSGSEYPERQKQCFAAASAMNLRSLREATMENLSLAKETIDEKTFQRARHVISENARTLRTAEALRQSDYKLAGILMAESHVSLRDDYEVSIPEIDTLVDIASRLEGVLGSRITGGGFGGCTVSLVKSDYVDAVMETILREYKERVGQDATCFVSQAGSGARSWQL